MRHIETGDSELNPEIQPFTVDELKVIHNIFMENGIPEGWITGLIILGKIEVMLNEFN